MGYSAYWGNSITHLEMQLTFHHYISGIMLGIPNPIQSRRANRMIH